MRRIAPRPVRPRARPASTLCAPMVFRSRISASTFAYVSVPLDVQHGLGEAGAHERVARCRACRGKCSRGCASSRGGPRRAQLHECVGAEGREGEQAAGLEHAPHFGERASEIVAPLQHEVADDEVDAGVRERQRSASPHTRLEAPEQAAMLAPASRSMPGADVDRDDRGARIASLERRRVRGPCPRRDRAPPRARA